MVVDVVTGSGGYPKGATLRLKDCAFISCGSASEPTVLPRLSLGFFGGLDNGDDTALAAIVMKLYLAVNESVKRVVAAHADVFAGVMYSTALANDDVAGYTFLTAPNLDTESLAV